VPDFTFESARKVYEQLAPKPAPENPKVVAARKLLERTPTGGRDMVGAAIIKRAASPDETMALYGVVSEVIGLYATKRGWRPLIRATGGVCHWTPQWSSRRRQ
jgi:hypothetical protein